MKDDNMKWPMPENEELSDADTDNVDVEMIDIESALEEFESDTDNTNDTNDINDIHDIHEQHIAEIIAEENIDFSESQPESSAEETGKEPPRRHILPYMIITVLAVSLVALGAITFLSLDRLASLQARVAQLQQTVRDISDSASSLSQKADELKRLQEEEAALENSTQVQEGEIQGPQAPGSSQGESQEEGLLSPSHGSQTFSNNTDESMDSLLAQIEPLLPQNNGSWSVYVCNLNKGTEGTIGGGQMQAASLIKLFIMGTVYENYESLSQLHGQDNLNSYLHSMITVSDNDAANILVNWLGSGDDANGMTMVNNFCKSHGYTETSMGRLLLQSNENGDNYTSVQDCGRFLKEIYEINAGTSTTATLTHADAMFNLLKLQERTHKIPAQLPEGVHTANKTGELSNVENDAGIIFDTAKGIDLVVCFMSQDVTDTAAAQASIAENARLIYGYYNE